MGGKKLAGLYEQVDFSEVWVKPGATYNLTAANAFFQTLTLSENSIFRIQNAKLAQRGQPVYLQIAKLVLNINGPASRVEFFRRTSIPLYGEDGGHGAHGRAGKRSSPQHILPTDGQNGGDGKRGDTIGFRGILYLKVDEVVTLDGRPIDRTMMIIDGEGVPGGRGGNGGRGGTGGNGVPGRRGAHECGPPWEACQCRRRNLPGSAGAKGGDGGGPGDGAHGGQGAAIYLTASRDIRNGIIAVSDLSGAEGGAGGKGGPAGAGGKGAARQNSSYCRAAPAQPNGASGSARTSERGRDGQKGMRGQIIPRQTFPVVEDHIREFVENSDGVVEHSSDYALISGRGADPT